MRYPDAPRLDIVETLHGRGVADPYRWLEDASTDECDAWSRAQDELVSSYFAGLPDRAAMADRLRALLPGWVGLPYVVGDRAFYLRREADQEFPVFCVSEGGVLRPLIDVAALDPSLTTALDAAVPSKDGTRVAYLLSHGGREESVLHVLDVESGADIADPVPLGRGADVAWLDTAESLVIVRRLLDVPEGEEQFHRRVWRHRVGSPPDDDVLLFGEGRDKTSYYDIRTSPDGRWLMVSAALGTAPRNDLYLFDMASPAPAAVAVMEGQDAQAYGRVGSDDRLYLWTDLDAPRGRLVVAPAESPTDWSELLPESDAVLQSFALADDAVVAVRVRDVAAVVTVHDRSTGAERGVVPLPGLGEAVVAGRADGGGEVFISYTDYVTPDTVFRYDVGPGELSEWAVSPGVPDLSGLSAERAFFTSADGTQVPVFVVSRAGVERDGTAPTILYGYGGFNVPLSPYYSDLVAAWVLAGGVYAVANLRGGSEYGEEWHRAGMRERKQNVFDDFAGAADWLVAQGYTSRERLGIYGGSNGGLLVGAALTQRPELFRAVVCSAPLLDMVRYELFGLGQTWNDEYGRADDPVEFEWLVSYSPYHRVVPGVEYPAVLFTVFEGDTRVDPLHARKLCAALQHATAASPDERPVLLRRESEVGHGARAVSRAIGLQTDVLAFFTDQLRAGSAEL